MCAFEIETGRDRIVDFRYLPFQENPPRRTDRNHLETQSIFGGGDCLIVGRMNNPLVMKVVERLRHLDYEFYRANSPQITPTILKKYNAILLLEGSVDPLYHPYLENGGRILLPQKDFLRGRKMEKGRVLFANLSRNFSLLEDYLLWLLSD